MRKNIGFESCVLAALSLMLVCVFVLSVYMYDYLESDVNEGTLAVFADNVRSFIDENDTVAAFLGLDDTEEIRDIQKDDNYIASEAEAYIKAYNSIYEDID